MVDSIIFDANKDDPNYEVCNEEQISNLVENQYYSALCYKALKNYQKAEAFFKAALKLYRSKNRMFNGYNELFDQIYPSDINRELKSIEASPK